MAYEQDPTNNSKTSNSEEHCIPNLQHDGNPISITNVKWMNDQIKTYTKEWTPGLNISNFFVPSYFSPNIKAVVNMKVLPDQVSVTGIRCWLEFVSSKHSDMSKYHGISILYTVNLSTINSNSEVYLTFIF